MPDDDGVLGNLPRSRPGRRSEKRAAGATRAAKPAAGPRRVAGAAAGQDQPAPARDTDPVGDALRTVSSIAGTGARVAQGVAREVLRRLPRP